MLPKDERITRGTDINRILKRKQFYHSSPLLRIIAEENDGTDCRLAVICSGKIGSPVARNRLKRDLIGMYTRNKHKIGKNMNFVIIPRVGKFDLSELEKELIEGLTTGRK